MAQTTSATAGTPWMPVLVALGVGYAMGSTPSVASIGRATFRGLLVLEEFVREILVPFYTLSVLVYALSRLYAERTGTSDLKGSNKSYSFASFSLPPALKRLSSLMSLSSSDTDATKLVDDDDEAKEEEEEDEGEKPIDMNGTYKNVDNHNFGDFLQAQGLPWFLCNAASKARPTHHFTHSSSKKLTIQIRGIIESETSYQIGGPHTQTTIRGRIFHDSLSYLYETETECVGVKTTKVAVGEGYEVHVQRRIVRAGSTWAPTPEENPDGHCTYDLDTPCDFDRLLMTNKIVYGAESEQENIIASQLFHRTD